MTSSSPPLRPILTIILCSTSLTLATRASALPTTSITFNVAGFQVTRVWAGSGQDSLGASRPSLGIPANLGAMRFSPDGNTLYVVGSASVAGSGVYAVSVTRDPSTHEVTNLVGPATLIFAGAEPTPGAGIDAGLELGPSGTLFYSYFDSNRLAERVGGTEMLFNLSTLGVPSSVGGLTFSPFRTDPGTGFGRLQVNTGFASTLFELNLAAAGGGFFTPTAKTAFVTLPKQNLAGMQYVPSAPYTGSLMYVANDDGEVHFISIDPATGFPIDKGTNQPVQGTANPTDTRFASGFGSGATSGPFGLEFDPINNDLFVSTWQGDPSVFNSIIQIQGFSHVTTTTTTVTTTTSTTTTTITTTTITTTTTQPPSTTSTSSTTAPPTTTTTQATTTTTAPSSSTSTSAPTSTSTTASATTSTTGTLPSSTTLTLPATTSTSTTTTTSVPTTTNSTTSSTTAPPHTTSTTTSTSTTTAPSATTTGAPPTTTVSSTTTTVPAGAACLRMGPSACDDGEPCTTDMCLPLEGCVHLDAVGFASVTCVCERPLVAECPSVPALITLLQGRSCRLFAHAESASTVGKAKRRLRGALRTLRAAERATDRASNGKITGVCGAALNAALHDAEGRTRNLLQNL